jgi:hypothetical protein
MSNRFESRTDLAAKIEWEGGIRDALDYGIHAADMPEGDEELTAAWSALEAAHKALQPLEKAVEDLLPEGGW